MNKELEKHLRKLALDELDGSTYRSFDIETLVEFAEIVANSVINPPKTQRKQEPDETPTEQDRR